MPTEGETVAGDRLDNLVRRCLRVLAWRELMIAPRLLVHVGYDLRLIVASPSPLTGPLDEIRSSGLFDSETMLFAFAVAVILRPKQTRRH